MGDALGFLQTSGVHLEFNLTNTGPVENEFDFVKCSYYTNFTFYRLFCLINWLYNISSVQEQILPPFNSNTSPFGLLSFTKKTKKKPPWSLLLTVIRSHFNYTKSKVNIKWKVHISVFLTNNYKTVW